MGKREEKKKEQERKREELRKEITKFQTEQYQKHLKELREAFAKLDRLTLTRKDSYELEETLWVIKGAAMRCISFAEHLRIRGELP